MGQELLQEDKGCLGSNPPSRFVSLSDETVKPQLLSNAGLL
jgi:hypothetical protein